MTAATPDTTPTPATAMKAACLVLTLLLAVAGTSLGATSEEILSVGDNGVPTFLRGDLGFVDPLTTDPNSLSTDSHLFRLSVLAFAQDFAVRSLDATGREQLAVLHSTVDSLGAVHVRLGQSIDGLAVDGAQLIVHADAATGAVYAVNGEFAPALGVATEPSIDAGRALAIALRELGLDTRRIDAHVTLAYVLDPSSRATLAWKALVRWTDDEGPHADWIYANAGDGSLVARHATIHSAKNWKTYSAGGGTGLPGGLLCMNNQPCGDPVAQAAHDHASATYDYYFVNFGRDSIDDNGATLVSVVHYQTNYNNAFFDGSRIVYGDGDGSIFLPLAYALDIGVHEFTHGLTLLTSGLIYQNESGALNESFSDIFAAAAEAWVDGGVGADTWKLAEDVFTPGIPGDAVRYLNDPAADGSSSDYYPNRYTGSADNGGVHINSGISNLAFYLLSEGGQHPRGLTTNTVPALGIRKAEQIAYRALTLYLTPSSNFEAARFATALAAEDLYGFTESAAVHQAWNAVGVPGGGGDGILANGVPVTGIAGAAGSQQFWTLDVPKIASSLEVNITGGSGDADLYVRFGSEPTLRAFDCRPYLAGNEETCTIPSPKAGTWHIMVRGYSSFADLTLVATWQ